MAHYNSSCSSVQSIENKTTEIIISDSWSVIDKSEVVNINSNESSVSGYMRGSNPSGNFLRSNVLSRLQPYVPFTVEELTFITTLDVWTNCNVRVMGLLKISEGEYYIESVDEPGGPFKVLLVLSAVERLPLLNEFIHLFGEIGIAHKDHNVKPFINVTFYKNIETGNVGLYKEALEQLKPYIPLFVSTKDNAETLDDDDDDDHNDKYYSYHQLCDNDEILYTDDDFILAYNK